MCDDCECSEDECECNFEKKSKLESLGYKIGSAEEFLKYQECACGCDGECDDCDCGDQDETQREERG